MIVAGRRKSLSPVVVVVRHSDSFELEQISDDRTATQMHRGRVAVFDSHTGNESSRRLGVADFETSLS